MQEITLLKAVLDLFDGALAAGGEGAHRHLRANRTTRLPPPGSSKRADMPMSCYENKSLILTTNIEFSKWGSVFTDDQMAAAMILQ